MSISYTFNEAVNEKVIKLANTIIRKQLDYGKDNILDFGEEGILVRSNDKFARLKNLYKDKSNPNNESLDDTWLDIAGYAILASMVRDGSFKLPLEGSGKKTTKTRDNVIGILAVVALFGIAGVMWWVAFHQK
jgi:hypothetical protein